MTQTQNAKDAARFAAALAPLQALLKDPPLMTPRCVAAVEEAIQELEWTRTSCVNAESLPGAATENPR